MTEFWYDPLATSRFLTKILMPSAPACAAGARIDGLVPQTEDLSVGRQNVWCKVQAHRSRLETRAKEYSMCASLRVSQNSKAK